MRTMFWAAASALALITSLSACAPRDDDHVADVAPFASDTAGPPGDDVTSDDDMVAVALDAAVASDLSESVADAQDAPTADLAQADLAEPTDACGQVQACANDLCCTVVMVGGVCMCI